MTAAAFFPQNSRADRYLRSSIAISAAARSGAICEIRWRGCLTAGDCRMNRIPDTKGVFYR
jgi:hypothetical protein